MSDSKHSKQVGKLLTMSVGGAANVIYYGNLIQSQTIDNEQSTTLMSTLALLNIF